MEIKIKYHLFRSKKRYVGQAITIGEYEETGFYFIPAADGLVAPEDNIFTSIEGIEKVLDDELELIRPKKELH